MKSREFHAWLVSKNVTPEQAQYLALPQNRGLGHRQSRTQDLSTALSILNAADVGIELFGEQGLQDIVADMNQSLFANRAART